MSSRNSKSACFLSKLLRVIAGFYFEKWEIFNTWRFENQRHVCSFLWSALHQWDGDKLMHAQRCLNLQEHRWQMICCCDFIIRASPALYNQPAGGGRSLSQLWCRALHTPSARTVTMWCVCSSPRETQITVFWLQTAPSGRWRPPAARGQWVTLGRWRTSSLNKRRPVRVEGLLGASTHTTTTFSRCFSLVDDRKTTKLRLSSLVGSCELPPGLFPRSAWSFRFRTRWKIHQ